MIKKERSKEENQHQNQQHPFVNTDFIFELFILTLETIRGYLFATNDNRKGP